ncbi:hypothetical protein [Aquimarina sp. RZ0]|uniref:hypothetical protein n=1 Tax=Aquimarina sp. RZ0 TaxID=2607730 RepID=UPI0011F2E56F|nr:hypothetical protein [Aquimarina sp. RZ0]KAA1245699.1 hypothetical protein F0000_10690 [Aquimarina sp. RZ0]
MRIRKSYLLLLIIGAILLSASCVKDLDFDQIEEVVLTPVFELDFIFSEFDMNDFVPDGLPTDTEFDVPREQLRDTVNYDLVGSDFAVDNLDRIELTFEVRNTIQREFTIQFQFLTDADQPIGELYTIPIQAGLGEGTAPVISFSVPNPIVLDNATLNELSQAQKIATEVIIPTLNTDLRGVLHIRSKASYFVNYEL